MNTAAKVALDKEKHPERYCHATRCLWRVVDRDGKPKADCNGGFCPRHWRSE